LPFSAFNKLFVVIVTLVLKQLFFCVWIAINVLS